METGTLSRLCSVRPSGTWGQELCPVCAVSDRVGRGDGDFVPFVQCQTEWDVGTGALSRLCSVRQSGTWGQGPCPVSVMLKTGLTG